MIKTWTKFNENTSGDLRSKLSEKLTEVRNFLIEFEDMGIITYNIIYSGFPRAAPEFHPRGDFERFLDMITASILPLWHDDIAMAKFGFENDMRTKRKYKVSEKDFCIIADIKIVAEPTEFGSTVIGSEGIKLFEDILVANSRLIDVGYDVKLDLNASHNQYKPAKFLIYFDL